MLEAMCTLLRGLSYGDSDTPSKLTATAHKGLIDLIRSVYGQHAADTVGEFFEWDTDGYVCTDEAEKALMMCLEGRGR